MSPVLRKSLSSIALIALLLAGCGGGSSESEPVAVFSLSATAPADHAGRLSLTDANWVSTELRQADDFLPEAYCLVRYANLRHDDGRTYSIAVAFRVADQRVMTIAVNHAATGWLVAAVQPDASLALIDRARRNLVLRNVPSTQGAQVGWQLTIDGQAGFPPAPGTSACG
jgi:hypothetical protein